MVEVNKKRRLETEEGAEVRRARKRERRHTHPDTPAHSLLSTTLKPLWRCLPLCVCLQDVTQQQQQLPPHLKEEPAGEQQQNRGRRAFGAFL